MYIYMYDQHFARGHCNSINYIAKYISRVAYRNWLENICLTLYKIIILNNFL